MCGIIAYFGQSQGVQRVLEALRLLEYRAPDSTGLALIDDRGQMVVRRSVGPPGNLAALLTAEVEAEERAGRPSFLKTAWRRPQIVVGHGRWAMVGAVNEANAHPLSDRSGTRIVCENGSHNAALMLGARADQAAWWRQRGLPEKASLHRSENTTEVIAWEWERAAIQIVEGELDAADRQQLASLQAHGIDDQEEQALRLALRRLSQGNAHACAFLSSRRPAALYASSHDKAIAIAVRTLVDGRREIAVASDVNAALMLWPAGEVEAAAARIAQLRQQEGQAARQEIESILDGFSVAVIFLDADLGPGPARDLFARIRGPEAEIAISRYDGTPLAVMPQRLRLNPDMAGKGGHASFTEAHIAEIPEVMDRLVKAYVPAGKLRMESLWQEGRLFSPGLNADSLQARFGQKLERLKRIVLAGEGSSWRDAQAAAPLFRQLLPDVLVTIYRPVELLNLGEHLDPAHDLAVEISWSGTTDSLLKVDKLLAELDVLRVAVTGRPQSDLGRRVSRSGGTLDVHTGVEVSVATVKGFQGILMTLDLLALALAQWRIDPLEAASLAPLHNDLTWVVPQQVRALLQDQARRGRIRQALQRCSPPEARAFQAGACFDKVIVIGDSPIDVEAELKIEELAQVVALSLDFQAESLRPLIESSALAGDDDRPRALFVVNASSPAAHRAARPILSYLRELSLFVIVHTTLPEPEGAWGALPNAEIFISPAVAEPLQPLIDAPFFFDLAVALAYARGLTAGEIDRPRNLAKSVTTTGAERRADLEGRRALPAISLAEFNAGRLAEAAWDAERGRPSRAALQPPGAALRGALAVLADPPPEALNLAGLRHLVVVTGCEATENGAAMARAAWQELAGVDLTIYRRFLADLPPKARPETARLRLIRAGAVLAVHDPDTVALPADLAPLQLEMLGATYLIGLAVRLARQREEEVAAWQGALAQIPLLAAQMLGDSRLASAISQFLRPYVAAGYDKLQIIGGGQDQAAAASIARSLRQRGFVAEALYTDSAWHGPLAVVGGPDAAHDALIVILASDPLFQAAALVDTQVYRARNAPVLLVAPAGSAHLPAVRQVEASAVVEVPAAPRPLAALVGALFGEVLARELESLALEAESDKRGFFGYYSVSLEQKGALRDEDHRFQR